MKSLSEKTSFILAFAAILVGFSALKDTLGKVKLDFLPHNIDLWTISLISFSLLSLSIYLYALDSARYGLPLLEENKIFIKIFKYIQKLAHIVYLIAIVLPIILILIALIITALSSNIHINTFLTNVITSIITFVIGIVGYKFQRKIYSEKENEIMQEKISELYVLSKNLVNQKKWDYVVIDNYKLIEAIIDNKAKELGLDSSKIPFVRLIDILVKEGVLTSEQAVELDEVRKIRNMTVHSQSVATEQEAERVIQVVKNLQTLVRPSEAYFEKVVRQNLQKIFDKIHILQQINVKGKRADFVAIYANRRYYIEVKLAERENLIRNAVSQLNSMLSKDDRGILVISDKAEKIEIGDARIKVLFYDFINNKFSNEKEIYDWVHNSNKKS